MRDGRPGRKVRDDARRERRVVDERVDAPVEVSRTDQNGLAGDDPVTAIGVVDELTQDRVRDVASARREVDERLGIAQDDARAAVTERAHDARQIGEGALRRAGGERTHLVTRHITAAQPSVD